jgi:hypothetical protein
MRDRKKQRCGVRKKRGERGREEIGRKGGRYRQGETYIQGAA